MPELFPREAAPSPPPSADPAGLFAAAGQLCADLPDDVAGPLRAALARWRDEDWTVLVAGLCSVGKSSFVCALWDDAGLTPTAVRDCTQTNTLVRCPAAGESDAQIRLSYLTRAQALDFALRDVSFYRLEQFLHETLGPLGPRLDEGPPEARLRTALASVRRLFAERAGLLILHEHLTDELAKLDDFLAFLESSEYRDGEAVCAPWEDRRAWLMGRRGPDGRPQDVGRLLSLRQVELVRHPGPRARWTAVPPSSPAGVRDRGGESLARSALGACGLWDAPVVSETMGRTEHQLPQDQQQLFRNPQSPISNPQSPIPNPQPPIPNPQSPISNPQSVPSLSPPRLLDTPWVPTFHNARRAELILEQAARADLLVVLALPDVYTPEPWVEQLLKKQPRAAKRLLLVLNQVDTVDRTTLFGRGGFSQAFEENLSRLRRMGVPEENVLIGCARLPFLESGPADAEVQSRAEKLRHVLGQLRRQVEPRPESAFKRAMLRACTPEDAGLGALRERLMALRLGLVRREREKAVLDALMEIAPLALPVERRDEWMRLRRQVASGKW